MVRAGGRSKTKASYADPEDSEESGVSEDESDSRRNSSPSKKSKSKKSKKEVSKKAIYREESDVDFTDAGEMDDEGDSDFEAAKAKAPAKRKIFASHRVWHKYTYDEELGKGVQGRLNQVIYPLLNIWGNWVDKQTT